MTMSYPVESPPPPPPMIPIGVLAAGAHAPVTSTGQVVPCGETQSESAHHLANFIFVFLLVCLWLCSGAWASVEATVSTPHAWITRKRVALWFAVPIVSFLVYLWTR